MASAQSIATGRGKRSVDIAPGDALGLSGMLSFPANFAKGIAPIAAASIWSFTHGYVAVEWSVFLVSILSAIAFFVAVRVSRQTTARTP